MRNQPQGSAFYQTVKSLGIARVSLYILVFALLYISDWLYECMKSVAKYLLSFVFGTPGFGDTLWPNGITARTNFWSKPLGFLLHIGFNCLFVLGLHYVIDNFKAWVNLINAQSDEPDAIPPDGPQVSSSPPVTRYNTPTTPYQSDTSVPSRDTPPLASYHSLASSVDSFSWSVPPTPHNTVIFPQSAAPPAAALADDSSSDSSSSTWSGSGDSDEASPKLPPVNPAVTFNLSTAAATITHSAPPTPRAKQGVDSSRSTSSDPAPSTRPSRTQTAPDSARLRELAASASSRDESPSGSRPSSHRGSRPPSPGI